MRLNKHFWVQEVLKFRKNTLIRKICLVSQKVRLDLALWHIRMITETQRIFKQCLKSQLLTDIHLIRRVGPALRFLQQAHLALELIKNRVPLWLVRPNLEVL